MHPFGIIPAFNSRTCISYLTRIFLFSKMYTLRRLYVCTPYERNEQPFAPLPPCCGYKRATIRGHIILCIRVILFICGQEYVRPFYVPHKTMMTLFYMWLKRDGPYSAFMYSALLVECGSLFTWRIRVFNIVRRIYFLLQILQLFGFLQNTHAHSHKYPGNTAKIREKNGRRR